MSDQPIGLLDSGVGGLTVLKALQQQLPTESALYFGDTARMPYGNRSPESVCRYCMENANFLLSQGIKLLVVACNTASSCALEQLRTTLPIPVIGVIDAGAQSALEASSSGRIGIMGTRATIHSGVYQNALKKGVTTAVACPLLATLIEENLIDHPATNLFLQEYLTPLQEAKIDTLLLACTHYPHLLEKIQALLPGVAIVDCAKSCAEEVKRLLKKESLFNEGRAEFRFFVSEDPEKFQKIGERFLGHPIEKRYLTLVSP